MTVHQTGTYGRAPRKDKKSKKITHAYKFHNLGLGRNEADLNVRKIVSI